MKTRSQTTFMALRVHGVKENKVLTIIKKGKIMKTIVKRLSAIVILVIATIFNSMAQDYTSYTTDPSDASANGKFIFKLSVGGGYQWYSSDKEEFTFNMYKGEGSVYVPYSVVLSSEDGKNNPTDYGFAIGVNGQSTIAPQWLLPAGETVTDNLSLLYQGENIRDFDFVGNTENIIAVTETTRDWSWFAHVDLLEFKSITSNLTVLVGGGAEFVFSSKKIITIEYNEEEISEDIENLREKGYGVTFKPHAYFLAGIPEVKGGLSFLGDKFGFQLELFETVRIGYAFVISPKPDKYNSVFYKYNNTNQITIEYLFRQK